MNYFNENYIFKLYTQMFDFEIPQSKRYVENDLILRNL